MVKPPPVGAKSDGGARPTLPVQVYAEDFSLLVLKRRLRIARRRIYVLS